MSYTEAETRAQVRGDVREIQDITVDEIASWIEREAPCANPVELAAAIRRRFVGRGNPLAETEAENKMQQEAIGRAKRKRNPYPEKTARLE